MAVSPKTCGIATTGMPGVCPKYTPSAYLFVQDGVNLSTDSLLFLAR
jgi:hypothetical protein